MGNFFQDFKTFLKHIYNNHTLLWTLINNDFKKQYLGSYLGIFWAFAQPLVYIGVIWFVFSVGFRQTDTKDGIPFFLWLISGMIPWFFFVNAFSMGTNAITSNAFLVKKVAFRVSILPLVQISSALIIHLVLVVLLMFSSILYGYLPSLYWLQLFYYIFLSLFLLIGLSWLTSSIRVFVKDMSNFVFVIIQVGFWATPVFWHADKIPQKYHFLLNINPMYYIVDGFRDTFIYHTWFWQKPLDTLYFIIISSVIFVLGAIVFKRLRPHFGDVL